MRRLFPARPAPAQLAAHEADVRAALEHAEALGHARHLARVDLLEERVTALTDKAEQLLTTDKAEQLLADKAEQLGAMLGQLLEIVDSHTERIARLAQRVTRVEAYGVRPDR